MHRSGASIRKPIDAVNSQGQETIGVSGLINGNAVAAGFKQAG